MALEEREDVWTRRTTTATVPRAGALDESAFLRGVYAWMAGGLALTAIVAMFTATSPEALKFIFGNKLVFYGLLIAEFGLVMWLSAAIGRLSPQAATSLFLLYAGLNGVTMSAIFIVYTGESLASTFMITAGMFGAMSFYGAVTKKDLSSWGSFLFMGLFGIVIASVVNIFMGSDTVSWVVSVCGVIVFTGLAAYDTNKLKAMARAGFGDAAEEKKGTIIGALALYLDFINLFLMLLRLFGRRR